MLKGGIVAARPRVASIIAGLAIALVVLWSPSSALGDTDLPSTISQDTTLTAQDSPYTGGSVTVASGVTLTVEPGARLKIFDLFVYGTLDAEGTASNPVVFTSMQDSGRRQSRGIRLETGSGASVIDHAEVRYSGYQGYGGINVDTGSPTITNSTIHDNGAGIVINDGGPEIANNTIVDNPDSGIYAYSTTGAAIHDNDVERNGESGIYINGSVTTLGGNTVDDNGSNYPTAPAFYFAGPGNGNGQIPPDIDENEVSGNNRDEIYVVGTLNQSTTWGGAVPLKGTLTIASGVTLTVSPGFVFRSYGALTVNGTLDAEGTQAEPITFTSGADNGWTGWKGIQLEAGSGASVLDHVEVRYAGYQGYAGVNVDAGSPTITNSVLHDNGGRWSGGAGVNVNSGSPAITHSSIHDNSDGVLVATGASPTISWNSFHNDAYSGVYSYTATHPQRAAQRLGLRVRPKAFRLRRRSGAQHQPTSLDRGLESQRPLSRSAHAVSARR